MRSTARAPAATEGHSKPESARIVIGFREPHELSWLMPATLSVAQAGATFEVVHATDPAGPGDSLEAEVLEAGVDLLRVHGVDARGRVMPASRPSDAILEAAADPGSAMIVLGSRTLRTLGPTVREVLARTDLPLLYVPRTPIPPPRRLSTALAVLGAGDEVPALVAGVQVCGVRKVVMVHMPRVAATVVDDALAAMRRAGWSATTADIRDSRDEGMAVESAAERVEADIVIVASDPRHPLGAVPTVSNRYAIAERARRPVLFMPHSSS